MTATQSTPTTSAAPAAPSTRAALTMSIGPTTSEILDELDAIRNRASGIGMLRPLSDFLLGLERDLGRRDARIEKADRTIESSEASKNGFRDIVESAHRELDIAGVPVRPVAPLDERVRLLAADLAAAHHALAEVAAIRDDLDGRGSYGDPRIRDHELSIAERLNRVLPPPPPERCPGCGGTHRQIPGNLRLDCTNAWHRLPEDPATLAGGVDTATSTRRGDPS